jgi:hypothetical protein
VPPPEIPSSNYHVSWYSNSDRTVVAENDAGNFSNPGAWSRLDWVWDGTDHIWVCHTTEAASSEQAAMNTSAPSETNPGSSGCNGGSWTYLTWVASH